jgi:hypothetical protein
MSFSGWVPGGKLVAHRPRSAGRDRGAATRSGPSEQVRHGSDASYLFRHSHPVAADSLRRTIPCPTPRPIPRFWQAHSRHAYGDDRQGRGLPGRGSGSGASRLAPITHHQARGSRAPRLSRASDAATRSPAALRSGFTRCVSVHVGHLELWTLYRHPDAPGVAPIDSTGCRSQPSLAG